MKLTNQNNPLDFDVHELLELAILDVEGYLEPEERDAFDRAFAAATPAVQAQVRREQTRWASTKPDLPAIDAPAHLRARVLAAFREDRLIRAAFDRSEDVVGQIRPSHGVNRLWRVGAAAAAAAAIALGVMTVQLQREYQDIASTVAANAALDRIRDQFGAGFDRMLLGEHTTIVQLVPVNAADGPQRSRPSGLLLVDRQNNSASFLVRGLSTQGDAYELVLMDNDGKVVSTASSFRSSPSQFDVKSLANVSLEGVATVALRRVGDSTNILVATLA